MKSAILVLILLAFVNPQPGHAQSQDNARELIIQAETKMKRVGVLAAEGQFEAAIQLAQVAMAEMDRAVSLDPYDIEVRLGRGLSYAAFPPYYGKARLALDELNAAIGDPRFQSLAKEERAHAFQALGIVYSNLADPDNAIKALRSAIEAAPDSRFGKDAAERVKTL